MKKTAIMVSALVLMTCGNGNQAREPVIKSPKPILVDVDFFSSPIGGKVTREVDQIRYHNTYHSGRVCRGENVTSFYSPDPVFDDFPISPPMYDSIEILFMGPFTNGTYPLSATGPIRVGILPPPMGSCFQFRKDGSLFLSNCFTAAKGTIKITSVNPFSAEVSATDAPYYDGTTKPASLSHYQFWGKEDWKFYAAPNSCTSVPAVEQ